MGLSKYETETTITMNDEDDHAVVWTCQRRIMTLMKKRGIKPEVKDKYGARYHVPKRWIKINPPRKVSEKQRETSRKNIAKIAQKHHDTHGEDGSKTAG